MRRLDRMRLFALVLGGLVASAACDAMTYDLVGGGYGTDGGDVGEDGIDLEWPQWPLTRLQEFEDRGITVFQPATGLEWEKTPADGEMTWAGAKAHCAGLAGGGWRLPTRIELATLVDYTIRDPASRFPGMPAETFWTSTLAVDTPDAVWMVAFNVGSVARSRIDCPTCNMRVRCVR